MNDTDEIERSPIALFKKYLYQYVKKNNLQYSKEREEVLKSLYTLSNPVTAQKLMETINKGSKYPVFNYEKTLEYIHFFKKIGWLVVESKADDKYILIKKLINSINNHH